MVAIGEAFVIGKIGKWKWTRLLAGELVELGVKVTVAGKDILGVEPFALGIAFRLLHSAQRVFVFSLRFEDCDWERCWFVRFIDTQQVINFTRSGPSSALGANWLNWRRRL